MNRRGLVILELRHCYLSLCTYSFFFFFYLCVGGKQLDRAGSMKGDEFSGSNAPKVRGKKVSMM